MDVFRIWRKESQQGWLCRTVGDGMRQAAWEGRGCGICLPSCVSEFATARDAYAVILVNSSTCPFCHYGNGENPSISL